MGAQCFTDLKLIIVVRRYHLYAISVLVAARNFSLQRSNRVLKLLTARQIIAPMDPQCFKDLKLMVMTNNHDYFASAARAAMSAAAGAAR